MKSPNQFIVKPFDGKRYVNTKEIGGIDFITNTSEENHKASTRYAVVVSTPLNYDGPIHKGDILLVHHNVFKFYNDIYGRRKSGKSFFMDDLFFVDEEQFFLYNQEGIWHTYDRYCFVKPIPTKESILIKNTQYEPLVGIMKYPNDYLKSQGIKEGDLVAFKPDGEYEFEIDGETLYRMYDHQVTIKLNGNETTKTKDNSSGL
jgi:hypothetical protein